MQPVSLRVRIGSTDLERGIGAERRNQPAQLSRPGAERSRQLRGVDVLGQPFERLGKRAIWSVDDRIARPIEDERVIGGGAGRELAHQPALARAGLATDQHHPQTLAGGSGKQRPQLLQLSRTADERERRGEAKRGGQLLQVGPRKHDSQI